jgi:predicted phage tail protein
MVPTAPRSLTATEGNRSATLTWLAPPSLITGAPISDYIVQRSADGGRTWRTINDGVSTARAVTVGGLTNGHRYRFRVAAVNNVGRGVWSAATSAVPATVPSSPRQLTATSAHRAAKLTWLAPSSNGGMPITDYVVQRSADGGRTWRTARDGVSIRSAATVNRLTSGKRYSFRVTAANRAGRGDWSAVVRIAPK